MDKFPASLIGAIEAAGIGLARLSSEELFVETSAAFGAMLGRTRGQLVGQSWRFTIHPEDHPRVEVAYLAARRGEPGYVEVRGLRADGSLLYQSMTISSIRNAEGDLCGFYCVRHDVSTRGARASLALELAVELAPNGLLLLDPSGRVLMANEAVDRLFGYPRQELIGQMVETLLPTSVRKLHESHRERFNSDPSMRAMAGRDLIGLRKDGREIPLQVYLNTIDTPDGKMILCTILDIAERVRYQEQLQLAKHAAESANRAKSDFLARMSHEIRTPMNLILGMNTLLLESELNETQRQHVDIANRNVKRLLRLINGILDLSKVEAGKLVLQAAPFDLEEVLREAVATISFAAEQKGLRISLFMEPGLWRYWVGDPERLQQVLLNLMGNAVKFTAHGSIHVRVCPETSPSGAFGLRFAVSDTGCGVPPEKTHLVFEAFQQGDGRINRTYEGTGLGLAISKTLVRMMGGEIWVGSHEGPGTTIVFTAFFPRSSREAVQSSTGEARRHQDFAGHIHPGTRVLIAEDNPENVFLLQAYLDGLGLEFDFATNGAEAVEKRPAGNYDLILMDIQMPVMDGYRATREIRVWESTQRKPRVPIVALTAHALLHASAEATEAGCDGYLSKPVAREDLMEAVVQFGGRRQAGRQASWAQYIEDRRPEFLSNRRQDLERLLQALAGGDFGSIQTIGHDCKGMSKGFGFPEIGLAGASLETAARARDRTAVQAALESYRAALEASVGVMPAA